MKHGNLSFNHSEISYIRWGQGDKILIALHGYGESGAHFRFLAEEMPDDWSVIAPDLPYHGDTVWKEKGNIVTETFFQLFSRILRQENCSAEKFSLLGYSMGGRISLHYTQDFPETVNCLTLVAPDGLAVNPWYWFSTRTYIGNRIFHRVMHRPNLFKHIAAAGRKLRLVNQSIYKFVQRYIDDPMVRHELYVRWTAMRFFRPNLSKLRRKILEFKIPVLMVYGRHDRIIPPDTGRHLRLGMEEQIRFLLLPTGHQLLLPTFVPDIVQQLTETAAEN